MTEVIALIAIGGTLLLFGVEIVRWKLRPEQRRLRLIKKIGGRR